MKTRAVSPLLPEFLQGDGRVALRPSPEDLKGLPYSVSVTRSTARKLVRTFSLQGASHHSGRMATVWVVLRWARECSPPVSLRLDVFDHWARLSVNKEN